MNSPKLSKWFYRNQRLRPQPGHRYWTTLELKQLRELAKQKLSSAQIGVALGRSRRSIYSACRYHKIKLRLGRTGAPKSEFPRLSSTETTRRWRARQKLLQQEALRDAAD